MWEAVTSWHAICVRLTEEFDSQAIASRECDGLQSILGVRT